MSSHAAPRFSAASRSIVDYLVQSGYIATESVVLHKTAIATSTGRNLRAMIWSTNQDDLLVKVATRASRESLAHEADVHEALLMIDDARPNVIPCLTGMTGVDRGDGHLTLKLISGASNARELLRDSNAWNTNLFHAIGRALGKVQFSAASLDGAAGFSPFIPWVTQILETSVSSFASASGAQLSLVERMQAIPVLVDLLTILRQPIDEAHTTIVHGDLKWDNILVSPPHEPEEDVQIWFADWEFAGVGDPLWDAGTVLSEFLALWALSIPIVSAESPSSHVHLAGYPMEQMQPAIRAFWDAYIEPQECSQETARERLLSSVRFSGARLIQTAYERAQTMTYPTLHMFLLMQLGLNVMQRPREAAIGLFGLHIADRMDA